MTPFENWILPFRPVLAAASLLVSSVCFTADVGLDRSDKAFLKEACQGGLAEVKMGEMAKNKSANADVKAFGALMVKDHGKANSELKALADSKKVDLPTDVSLVAKGETKLMDTKSGADFDKAYASDMVDDHKKDVAAFEKASMDAKDPDVKAFAAKTLPTLRHHLTMAEEMQKKVGN
jgi:putative membrane protein